MAFSAVLREAPAQPLFAPLRRTQIAAKVIPALDRIHHIVVHALSSDGIVIECHDPLVKGDQVTFEIPDFAHQTGTINSRDGVFYDCSFDADLDPRRVASKLARTKVVWPGFRGSDADEQMGPWRTAARSGALDAAPANEVWPLPVRALIIVGGSLAGWGAVIALFIGILA